MQVKWQKSWLPNSRKPVWTAGLFSWPLLFLFSEGDCGCFSAAPCFCFFSAPRLHPLPFDVPDTLMSGHSLSGSNTKAVGSNPHGDPA